MNQGRDPRQQQQQQHPFPQNITLKYSQKSFPLPSPNRAPFSSPHLPPGNQNYPDNNRRLSDPYYKQQRSYGQEATLNHARNQIGSVASHGMTAHLNNMPPPSSPQQHTSPSTQQNYDDPPPLSRGLSGTIALYPNIPAIRENPIQAQGGIRAGGMAIADILGGPSQEPNQRYGSSVKVNIPSVHSSTQNSSRANLNRPEYSLYRRPQTPPDHTRQSENRESMLNSVVSPNGIVCHTSPESQSYDTPQQLRQPCIQQAIPHKENKGTIGRTNSIVLPARPNSQPNSYSMLQSHDSDRPLLHLASVCNRRVDLVQAPSDILNYNAPNSEEMDQQNAYIFTERERAREHQQEREAMIHREREKALERDRDNQMALQKEGTQREKQDRKENSEHENNLQRDYHQTVQRKSWNSRPPEARDWTQNGNYELPTPSFDSIPEREDTNSRPSIIYGYSSSIAPQSVGQDVHASNEHHFGTHSLLQSRNNSTYETAPQERHSILQPQHVYNAPPQSSHYHPHESSTRKQTDELQPIQQRNLLVVQDINRKERVSPIPQVAQGSQNQMVDGPSGEPSIKNEFGRMFSGIGSGVGTVHQVSSPCTGLNFTATSGLRRDDLESLQELQSIYEPTTISTQGPKRRKIQQEDKSDDQVLTGRNTPSRRVQRPKASHQHNNQRLVNPVEPTCPTRFNLSSTRDVKSRLHSPQDYEDKPNRHLHHHHVPARHHHHHHHHHHYSSTSKGSTPTTPPSIATTTNFPTLTILNDAILNSVADRPRHHLGYGYYHCNLQISPCASSLSRDTNYSRPFASIPDALPLFSGCENCTYTVKIPRVYLEDPVREEITSRKSIWGTDIYTDDSDVLAACIHGGWFRGAWHEEIDVSLLGLELKKDEKDEYVPPDEIQINQLLESPSDLGPGNVPPGCDCHVTVLILPLLEQYASSTRFGIRSREWGVKRDGWKGRHDGLSFMIKSVRFLSGVDGEEGRSGSHRRKIVQKQLQEKNLSDITFSVINGNQITLDASIVDYSNISIGFKGLGMGGWWKKRSSKGNLSNADLKPSRKLELPVPPTTQRHKKACDTSTKLIIQTEPLKLSTVETNSVSPTTSSNDTTRRIKIIDQVTQCMIKNVTGCSNSDKANIVSGSTKRLA